jgi:hypothetical protein
LDIYELTEGSISFRGYADTDNAIFWFGSIDRVSGEAHVTSTMNNKLLLDYWVTCKPANPLL